MILALETATTACSAALCAADGSVVAETVTLEGPAHTQRLLPGVHAILEQAHQSVSQSCRHTGLHSDFGISPIQHHPVNQLIIVAAHRE